MCTNHLNSDFMKTTIKVLTFFFTNNAKELVNKLRTQSELYRLTHVHKGITGMHAVGGRFYRIFVRFDSKVMVRL